MCGDECHHLCVGDRPAPAVLNRLGHIRDRLVRRWRGQRAGTGLELVLALRLGASVVPRQ
jgi:hypothetical protein